MSRHDMIEVTVLQIHETTKAILVFDEKDEEFWLPKSQIVILKEKPGKADRRGLKMDVIVLTLEIPEWLAEEKGLL